MKKIALSILTTLFSFFCYFVAENYSQKLFDFMPHYAVSILLIIFFAIAYRFWVTVVLGCEMSCYRMGIFTLKPACILFSLLLPAMTVSYFYLFGLKSPDFCFVISSKFINNIFLFGFTFPVIQELTIRGLVFQSIENILGRTFAVIIPSVIYAVISVLSFRDSFHPMLYTFFSSFLFQTLLALVCWYGDSVYGSIIMHVLFTSTTIIFDFSKSSSLWIINVVECCSYFVVIAAMIFLVVKKHHEEVLYW